ncbi:MAG: NAD(P)-dependent oxidoreductase [Methylobacteriaceae bacterium]|nr:NAD(P)-dependent oxidoreductase [Methylobacteriaceae bacterium]
MTSFTVLGASGFIGTHLVKHLGDKGHHVWTPNRGDPAIFKRHLHLVFYCIGMTTDYLRQPLDTVEAHVSALGQVLQKAQFDKLVYLSSVRLYDGLAGEVSETDSLRLDPLRPRHVYDFSKGLGEAMCHHAGRPAVVARLGSVFDDKLSQSDFLCATIRSAAGARELSCASAPDNGRDYIHIEDVTAALEAIALGGRESVYNVASGIVFTNAELGTLLERELGCRLKFEGSASQERPPTVSISRLQRDFGRRPLPPDRRLPAILKAIRAAKD